MKEQIIQQLQKIVKELSERNISAKGGWTSGPKIDLTIPQDSKNGDFTSNIAFALAKKLGKSPMEIAEKIVGKFPSRHAELDSASPSDVIPAKAGIHGSRIGVRDDGRVYLEKVEAVKPGFINFSLSTASLSKNLQQVLYAPEKIAGIESIGKGQKAIVEYSSPNIAKPFTVGHLRSTIIGDAIANLMEAVGYVVYRDNHLGDWGTQFGKQIYAIKAWGSEEQLDKSQNPIKDLVALYVKFHEEAEKDTSLEDEARKWFKKLEDGDKEARRLWQKCIDWSFKEFDRIYKELGVTFTENNGRGYGESYFEGKMQPIIKELEEKKLLKEDKGAKLIYYPEDKLPPLMLIKSDGATLYATRDLATDKFRLEQYGKDILVINEVGMEQSLYWRQIFEAEEMLGWYKKGHRVHIGHGMFRFKEGKMSTRKGNVIWLQDVLDEAVERAKKLGSDNETTAKDVAIGALKWNDLKRNFHMDITFDWDEILNMQGNSGPYIQYAYTRTQSILTKSGISNIQYPISNIKYNEEELNLLRKLYQFPEIVQSAAKNYSPNIICEYLFETAQLFNNFYQKYRIVNAEKKEEQQFRLALTEAVGIILKQGLHLLGIKAPERM